MCVHCKNRLLATSLALAAAGILTCAAALLDAFLPRGTIGAFLAWLFLAGLAVAAITVGCAWACDKLEGRIQSRAERLELREAPGQRAATSARGGHPAVNIEQPSPHATPQPARRLPDYPLSLRGLIRPADFCRPRIWHGQ